MPSLPNSSSAPTGTSLPAAASAPSGTSLPAGGAVPNISDIFGSALVSWRVGADAVHSGGTLTGWADRVGGSALSAIAGAPAVSTDATLGAQVVTYNGTTDGVTQTMDRPPPNAEPTCIVAVVMPITWTATDSFWGAGSNTMALVQITSTPLVCARNTTAGPTAALTLGAWKMVSVLYSGSVSDYLRIGSGAKNSGTNTGTTDPGANFSWGMRTGGANANVAFAEKFVLKRDMTDDEFTAVVTYFNSKFPQSVTS